MREYHLKPWEIPELTLVEMHWLCEALRDDEDDGKSHREGQDPSRFLEEVTRLQEEAKAFLRLSPEEQLRVQVDEALEEHGR